MRVNCGVCRSEFVVPGPGEFACPVCGTRNRVESAPQSQPANSGLDELQKPGGPPPVMDAPSPRTRCGECEFEFIVGDIDVAVCPNCGAEVRVKEAR